MKPNACVCFVVALTASVLRAGPAESAIVAAMKLSDAPNYGWVADVVDDARSYTIDGKTSPGDKSDYSLVNMPMIAAMRRRVGPGGANSDNLVTAIFKGDEKLVIQVNDAWKKPDELSPSSANGARGGGFGGMGRRGRRGGMMGGSRGGGVGGDNNGDGQPARPYSNLQLTLSRPHEELAIIVAGYSDLKSDGDVVSGALSDTAAKLLLVHPGQKEITPLTASGTFRLWVRDGVIVKYEVKLEGTLAVTAGGDRHEVTVHQTTTTQIRDVGTTTFDVPDDAKKKLGA